jgi:hypothetical protein
MVSESDPDEACRRRLHEWLFLLLRFAITRDPSDRAAALAMADELDSLGMQWWPAAPQFFLQTSHEVCDAIQRGGDWHTAALRKHAARIEHVRLRRAFLAAIDIPLRSDAPEETKGSAAREHLWLGLAKR